MAATPLCDGAAAAAPLVRPKIVRLVCAELRDTEMTYVANMQMLLNKFAGPLRDEKLCADLQLSEASRQSWQTCHGALRPIVEMHGWIETDLKRANSNPDAASAEVISAVVKAIEDKAPFFGLYNSYIDCYLPCLEMVKSESSKKFSTWLHARQDPKNEKLDSLLIMPIQRLGRYDMLTSAIAMEYSKELKAQGIIVGTPRAEEPTAWQELKALCTKVRAKVTEINEKQRTSEQGARLRSLSSSIRGLKPGYEIMEPHRRFISDALCSQVYPKLGNKKQLQAWLCNDVLILSTELSEKEKECKLKGWIELADVISVQALSSAEGHALLPFTAGNKDVTPKLDRCIAITSRIDASTQMAAPSPTASASSANATAAIPAAASSGGPGSARKSRKSFTPQANKSLKDGLKNIFGGASVATYTAEASPTAGSGAVGAFFPSEQLLILELDSEARKTQWVQQLQTLMAQRDAAVRCKSPTPAQTLASITEVQAKKRLCVSSDDTPTCKSPRTKLASSPAAYASDASLAAVAASVPITSTSPLTTPVRESSVSRQHVSPDSNLELGSIPLDASWSSEHDGPIGSGQASANTSAHMEHSAISAGDVNISHAFDLSSAVAASSTLSASAADESMESAISESAISASSMMICIDEEHDDGLVLSDFGTAAAATATVDAPAMDRICEEGEDSIAELNQSAQSTRRTSQRLSGHKRTFEEAEAKPQEATKEVEVETSVAVAYTHAAQPAAAVEETAPAAPEEIVAAPTSALALIATIPIALPAPLVTSAPAVELAAVAEPVAIAPVVVAAPVVAAPIESSLPFASPTVFTANRSLTDRPTHRRQRNGSIADLGALTARGATTRSMTTITPRKGSSTGLAAAPRFQMSPSVLAPSSLPISAPLSMPISAFGRLPNFLAPTVSSAAKSVARPTSAASAASVSGARSAHAHMFVPDVSAIASLASLPAAAAAVSRTPRSAGRFHTARSATTISASPPSRPTHRVTRSTVEVLQPENLAAIKLLGQQVNSPRALGVSTRAGVQREATTLLGAQDASTPQKTVPAALATPRGHSRTPSVSAMDCVSKLTLPAFSAAPSAQQHADEIAGDENM